MTQYFSGRRLTYYEQWDTTSDNVGPLLASRDGKCGAFAELFINALKVAGVEFTPIEPFQVASDGNFENMLINSWPFVGVGAVNIILNFRIYNYSNTLSNPAINPDTTDGGVGSFTRKNQDGEWEYYWGANVEVDELIGLPGQNTENPKSHFSDHWLVKISGKYYDPSYGSKFDSLLDWENASVGGFSRTFHHNPFNHSIILRKNTEGLDVKTLPAGM